MVFENGPSNYTSTYNFLDHFHSERRIKNVPRDFERGEDVQ